MRINCGLRAFLHVSKHIRILKPDFSIFIALLRHFMYLLGLPNIAVQYDSNPKYFPRAFQDVEKKRKCGVIGMLV